MARAVHGLRSSRLERVSLGFSVDVLMTTTGPWFLRQLLVPAFPTLGAELSV